jgi:hypothetical protein
VAWPSVPHARLTSALVGKDLKKMNKWLKWRSLARFQQ